MKRLFRPRVEHLEGRHMLATATGINFPVQAPVLGRMFSADRVAITSPAKVISTSWTEQIVFRSYLTPIMNLPNGPLSTTLVSTIPGTYTVTATSSYQSSNPTVGPPPTTTVSNTITIPAPDAVTKGGGVGVPTRADTIRMMTDPVTAGGQPIEGYFIGQIQESIVPFLWWDGTGGGSATWGPSALSPTFYFAQSNVNDGFMEAANTAFTAAPPGQVLCSFTQEFRFVFTMTTTAGDVSVTIPLNSLSWSWVKTDTTHWEAL